MTTIVFLLDVIEVKVYIVMYEELVVEQSK